MTVLQGGISNDAKDYMKTYLFDGENRYFFNIVTRESFESHTKTSDHYLEDGTEMQDHAVDFPVTYTLSGLVAERVMGYIEPDPTPYIRRARMQDTLRKAQSVMQIAPKLSSYVYSAINAGRFIAGRVTSLIKSAQGLFGTTVVTDFIRDKYQGLPDTITGMYGLTKDERKDLEKETLKNKTEQQEPFPTSQQKKALAKFEVLRISHTLLTLYSPYGTIKNVIIEDISCEQDKYWSVSNITVTVKQINMFGQDAGFAEENEAEKESQRAKLVKNGDVKVAVSNINDVYKRVDGTYLSLSPNGYSSVLS